MGAGERHVEVHPFPQAPSRRGFLKTGAGIVALSATDTVRTFGNPTHPPAEAAIVLWLQGGLSHVDTFDPKPSVSPFRPIPTSVDGVFFSELLPHTAAQMHRLCVIRSMSHEHGTHERAAHAMLTGRDLAEGTAQPCFLSMAAATTSPRGRMPRYVADPGTSHTARLGYLGPGPASDAIRPTSAAALAEQLPATQLAAINSASPRDHALYGTSDLGHRLRRACRLIERGVRCVVIDDAGWDDHRNIEPAYRRKVPALDRAFAGLIRDLADRELLARTMVLLLTEFGRLPRLNCKAGRDHNPQAFSAVVAGGSISAGQIIGASDAMGSCVVNKAVRAPELVAAILQDPGTESQNFTV